MRQTIKHAWSRSFILLSLSCTSGNPDWDSGAQRQEAIQDESQQSMDETTRDQFPTSRPGTERTQPF